MSLMFDGGSISSTAFILLGFASIPWLLTTNPKNFQAETDSFWPSRLFRNQQYL